ncbi:dolichyl-diphosphooligosaccharide--protein glycosyltransferase subunit STT3 [Candidatus Bathyarchaeota archaeon]|nr:dolichyl-diphosphooligosaccharide--protein glycosyltransferase subunit STT3 [Candidatus Bathyarchaeota archaeon]
MNKRIVAVIAIIVVAAVVIGAVSYYNLTQKSKELPTSTEHVGGRYNATLSFFKDGSAQIEYTDETGNHSEHYFESEMRTGLDWINGSTPENATFLCWWDYGHAIKGYAERKVTGRNVSHEWIEMVQIARTDPSAIKEFDPNEKLVDVAKALTTSNGTETRQIMEKYGATYVVVYKDDGPPVGKVWWMFKVAGLDPASYWKLENSTQLFNDAGKQTMLSRLLDNRDTGFTLVYQDESMKVYKID